MNVMFIKIPVWNIIYTQKIFIQKFVENILRTKNRNITVKLFDVASITDSYEDNLEEGEIESHQGTFVKFDVSLSKFVK